LGRNPFGILRTLLTRSHPAFNINRCEGHCASTLPDGRGSAKTATAATSTIFFLIFLALSLGPLAAGAAEEVRLVTLEPGHFHAALFHKERLPGVADKVHVYAPQGPDLRAHLDRLAQFNARAENPTRWQIEVHAGPNPLERLLAERPGNVVVISGRNAGKIDRITALARAGLHTLADKPWIIEAADFPKVEAACEAAERAGVVAYDAMTERFEITYLLQRELVNDAEIFGHPVPRDGTNPAVRLASLHYLFKEVAGAPVLRPAWFFDIRQQGEALADVGTHLVDLIQWTLFPDQAIDYRRDIGLRDASRAPVVLTRAQFQRVTGEKDFPEFLRGGVKPGGFEYFVNNKVRYTLRGIEAQIEVQWSFEAPAGKKETQAATYCGSRARVEVLKGEAEGYRPEVYVTSNRAAEAPAVRRALRRWSERTRHAGISVLEQDGRFRLAIPPRYRVGHEDHFALLVRQFLGYVRAPETVPAWEKPNLLAKYFVTTHGVDRARKLSENE
jgi:predicted dehydrogenase